MSGVEGSSVPPPGWKEGQSGPVYASASAPPTTVAQPVMASAEALAPIGAIAGPVVPMAQPIVASGQPAAEAAVRWRVRAATLDNLLVYALFLVLCWMLGWRPLTV